MTVLYDFVPQAMFERIGWALFHSLWQATAIAMKCLSCQITTTWMTFWRRSSWCPAQAPWATTRRSIA